MAAGYQMNPQIGRAMAQPPAAVPQADGDVGAQTITLTKNPDGTVTCDDGTGQPTTHQSVDEALTYASQKLGGAEPAGDETAPGSGSDVDDQY